MKDIPLNDFTLDILNEALWFAKPENYKQVQLTKGQNWNEKDADYYTGIEYFEKIRGMGRKHDGFPEVCVGHSFGVDQTKYHSEAYQGNFIPSVSERQEKFMRDIQTTFTLKKNALFNIYPPGGYISWHNNANASAFNFIFTYSETGDGYWKHYDPVEDRMVTIPDEKGWQCKCGYFGAYVDGKDKLCYHTARNGTSGVRMTIAFVLDRTEIAQNIQSWVIEDISE